MRLGWQTSHVSMLLPFWVCQVRATIQDLEHQLNHAGQLKSYLSLLKHEACSINRSKMREGYAPQSARHRDYRFGSSCSLAHSSCEHELHALGGEEALFIAYTIEDKPVDCKLVHQCNQLKDKRVLYSLLQIKK